MRILLSHESRTTLIRRAYFMRGSVHDIALAMRELGFEVNEHDIESEWEDRATVDPLFNQARPEFGFPSGDKATLCQRLTA